jgi:hypothetical protein
MEMASAGERVFGRLIEFILVFEPLAPQAISYYMRRRLSEWKQQGLISGYETRTRRLGKFHYKIEVDLDLTAKQTLHALGELFPNQLENVRR